MAQERKIVMKKILFVMPTLRDGGAERSLVNLLTELPEDKYEIDLLLLKKQGTFLSQVPSYVNILEQPPILKKLYGPVRKAGIYMPVKVFGNLLARIVKSGMGNQKAFMWEYFYKPIIDGLDKEYDVAVGFLGGESTYYIVDKVKAKRKNYIYAQYPAVWKLHCCIKEFRNIFKKRNVPLLYLFIEKYCKSTIKAVKSFAEGLKRDIVAVENAVAYDYSNGFVEGTNSRLKMIKRTMYGRCRKQLLEAKLRYVGKSKNG